MNNVYHLIGGNMGERMAKLAAARNSINIDSGRITATSSIYEKEVWGYKEQHAFLNQDLLIEHPLEATKHM